MGTDQIQYERELFERHVKWRAPGVNLQKLGDEYIDRDVQLHFETWLARAAYGAQMAQVPVATVLPPDPLDERPGPWLSRDAWDRLRALPPGTKLYAGTGNTREAADQDRDRRDEVAKALGLLGNGDFSWAFLIQKIRECARVAGSAYSLPFRLQR